MQRFENGMTVQPHCRSISLACGLWLGAANSSTSAPRPPCGSSHASPVRTEQVCSPGLPSHVSSDCGDPAAMAALIQKRLFEEGAEIEAGQVACYQTDPASCRRRTTMRSERRHRARKVGRPGAAAWREPPAGAAASRLENAQRTGSA